MQSKSINQRYGHGNPYRNSQSYSQARSNELEKFAVYPSMNLYDLGTQVGEGTYGQVFKAKNKRSGEFVAMKKLYLREDIKGNEKNRDGFPITAIREIEILRSLKHENIVELRAMVSYSKGMGVVANGSPTAANTVNPTIEMFMVFEYMDHDLTGILNHNVVNYSLSDIKCLTRQMFEGLKYLHDRMIIHRDIKGANLLLNSKGYLKIADFGLARRIHIDRDSGEPLEGFEYTNRVVTLWYRSPELLLGTSSYGYEVDIWSAGCILVEFFTKLAIFQGKTEIDQLELIFKLCGTPTEESWPSMKNMPWNGLFKFQQFPRILEREFKSLEGEITSGFLDLMGKILTVNPDLRPSAEEILNHPFYTSEEPKSSLPSELPHIEGDWHEYEGKLRRKEKRLGVRQAQATEISVSSQSKTSFDPVDGSSSARYGTLDDRIPPESPRISRMRESPTRPLSKNTTSRSRSPGRRLPRRRSRSPRRESFGDLRSPRERKPSRSPRDKLRARSRSPTIRARSPYSRDNARDFDRTRNRTRRDSRSPEPKRFRARSPHGGNHDDGRPQGYERYDRAESTDRRDINVRWKEDGYDRALDSSREKIPKLGSGHESGLPRRMFVPSSVWKAAYFDLITEKQRFL